MERNSIVGSWTGRGRFEISMAICLRHFSTHSLWSALDCFGFLGAQDHIPAEHSRACSAMEIPQKSYHGRSPSVSRHRFHVIASPLSIGGNRQTLKHNSNAFLTGGPWFATAFQLPQRYQLVYGTTSFQAGIRLMAFTAPGPLGAVLVSFVVTRFKVPPLYFIIFASTLQIAAFASLYKLPETTATPDQIYGLSLIAGVGCGLNITTVIMLAPYCVDKRDKSKSARSIYQAPLTCLSCRNRCSQSVPRHGWCLGFGHLHHSSQWLHEQQNTACQIVIPITTDALTIARKSPRGSQVILRSWI
jgi:hypothetical protein